MTLEIELAEPYEKMLQSLRENGESDPDADLQQLVEQAIHNGYQEMTEGR